MDRKYRLYVRVVRASTLLLLLAATATAEPTRGDRREERSLRRLYPITLALGERRLVDRRLVDRIHCQGGVLVVRPFGRSVFVQCLLRL
ncbi:MAG TPA: hypothetical protein VN818_02845 [Gammaproteobacteria bacterium]|nr:hypothetical protein [Gammaproteobacteria bacterium]